MAGRGWQDRKIELKQQLMGAGVWPLFVKRREALKGAGVPVRQAFLRAGEEALDGRMVPAPEDELAMAYRPPRRTPSEERGHECQSSPEFLESAQAVGG